MALFYDNILSSSDDDEMFYTVQRRPRVFRERVNYFETMDDLDFLTRFRLRKMTVQTLLFQIEQKWDFINQFFLSSLVHSCNGAQSSWC